MAAVIPALLAALLDYLYKEWEEEDKDEEKAKTYEQIMAEARARICEEDQL